MPGEPVCRRESRAGEPVVDSGYMEPASLVLTCPLLHGRKILEEKQSRGEVVQKGQSGLPRRLCDTEGPVCRAPVPHTRWTDQPMGDQTRWVVGFSSSPFCLPSCLPEGPGALSRCQGKSVDLELWLSPLSQEVAPPPPRLIPEPADSQVPQGSFQEGSQSDNPGSRDSCPPCGCAPDLVTCSHSRGHGTGHRMSLPSSGDTVVPSVLLADSLPCWL